MDQFKPPSWWSGFADQWKKLEWAVWSASNFQFIGGVIFLFCCYFAVSPSFLAVFQTPRTQTDRMTYIDRSVSFNPEIFFGSEWRVAEEDARYHEFAAINFGKMKLATCLKEGESWITGEEKLRRLKKSGDIRLGADVFLALWNEEGQRTLEWLRENRSVTRLDFFGTILENPSGNRCVFCLYRDGDAWVWGCPWLDGVWFSSGPAPVLLND